MLLNKLIRGSALLTSLFIMTLVAIVATAMSTKLQVDIYRTRLLITHDKLYLASQGVAFWAMGELNNNKNKFAHLNQDGMVLSYPKKMANIYPSVTLSGGIYDLQALFNLNNLGSKKTFLGFMNFLHQIAPQINSLERMNLAFAIKDWISPYNLAKGKDKYLSYYLKQKPPYYPSHQLFGSRSELRLIIGVSGEMYETIAPFITALPETTAVNINTASPQVLMSLSHVVNENNVKEVIAARGKNGIKKIEQVTELLNKLNITPNQATIQSTYFLSVAHATTETLHLTTYTLLKRSKAKNGKLTVSILRESMNIF